ncbi:MAG: hypothetical protein HY774_07225 [Acidobacteria bacterium]|nr:hypothetical protein [Acidobacteriota bacterium]
MPPITVSNALLQEAHQYKRELLERMFGTTPLFLSLAPTVSSQAAAILRPGSNISGFGYGAKETLGAGTEELAVRVYVRSKLPNSLLSAGDKVPSQINGMPTDVIAVGDVVATARPVKCGVSVGHFQITAGTLGCLVKKTGLSTGDHYILSNNHVLADSNAASIGDDILEPGPADGGTSRIAELTDFEAMDFTGNANTMDAAIAKVDNLGDVFPEIETIGRISNPPMPAALYQSVRKHGRTTRHTIGVIMDLSADIWVRYGGNRAWFEDQISIIGAGGNFSAGGDSGSLIVDGVTKRPVALLFAGGGNTTFGNPIEPVLSRFQVEIL